MSDQKNAIVSASSRTAVGLTLGLAFSIPLTTSAAMAHPADWQPRVRNQRAPNQVNLNRQQVRQERQVQRQTQPARVQIERQRPTINTNVTAGADTRFNLNSSRPDFSAGNIGNFQSLTINVGGKEKTITIESKLTAAEVVAADQVLNAGKQTILLKANGVAAGGTVTLNSTTLSNLDRYAGDSIDSMTIARGVQLIDNLSGLNLSGSLRNFGSILTAADVSGASNTISADSIINHRTGTISSYDGQDHFAADVVLNADRFLTNNGRIASNGNLTITAPVVTNAAGAVLNAGQNVNLNTSNLVNAGSVAAGNNINVASTGALTVDGTDGTFAATNANINFATNNADLNINGGNLYSQAVNLTAGKGTINATVEDATGVVNASACVIHVYADTDNLNLGAIEATGDPIITNTGNILITNAIASTNGEPLTLIAGGNILSNAGNTGLDTSNAAGDGGALTLIAGAKFTVGTTVTVGGKSTTGGLIDLTGGNGGTGILNGIDTSGSAGKQGGDIQMYAFAGKTVGTGSINLTGVTIDAGGTGGNGDVVIVGSAAAGNTAVTTGNMNNVGGLTVASATPTAKKVAFDPVTGKQVSGSFTFTKKTSGNLEFGGVINADGKSLISTNGATNISGQVNFGKATDAVDIATGSLNVLATGKLFTASDKTVMTSKVTGATTIDGLLFGGDHTLSTNTLTINAGGQLGDAKDSITAKGAILVNGLLGRDPQALDPNRAITTFNVTTPNTVTVNPGGVISGDGKFSAKNYVNKGTAKGSIAYTATGSGIAFDNFGLVDGLAVTVSATKGSIQNEAGAFLQATLQTVPEDIPTLTLNTAILNNLGHIEAVGRPKLSEGVLTITSTGNLTISGVDGGFVTAFSGGVNLNAVGDIKIGGVVNNVNSNPFSLINTGLGEFKVATKGSFLSTLPGITATSDGQGNYGEISFVANSIKYNGVGAAPNFLLTANGDAQSKGKAPITLNLTSTAGVTIGLGAGQISTDVNNFDGKSITTVITPTNLNIDMDAFDIGGTSLLLVGTKNLLIDGNVIGGENVTVTTNSKSAFKVGGATTTGQKGLGAGEGISAGKTLTINAPGAMTIGAGAVLKGGETLTLNTPALTVENTGDALSKNMSVNMGASTKAKYTNLNPQGGIGASSLTLNASKALTLSSGGTTKDRTVLSILGLRKGAEDLLGGGAFTLNAGSLKFSTAGLTLIARSPGVGAPNGGEIRINTPANKQAIAIGHGKKQINVDVTASAGHASPDGSGLFSVVTAGPITAVDVFDSGVNPSVKFGPNGSGRLSLNSTTSTVSVDDITGIGVNLLSLASGSNSAMLLTGASKNGIKDKNAVISGGNLQFTNFGEVRTNGIGMIGVEIGLTSGTSVNTQKNLGFVVLDNPNPMENTGGIFSIDTPVLTMDKTSGLAIVALGGKDGGGVIDINVTGTNTLNVDSAGNALHLDVSNTKNNKGGSISVISGGALKIDGAGTAFGAATNKLASLNLQSGPNSPLTFNNAVAPTLAGLAFGTVTLNSGSNAAFLLDGASTNKGNGLSNGALKAGAVVINPISGDGIIDTTGYKMTTNALSLLGSEIRFDNQTITVLPDTNIVGKGEQTGNGGGISIVADTIKFAGSGGVKLVANGTGGDVSGTIGITDGTKRALELGADGFSFDVTNPGGKGGKVSVNSAHNIEAEGSVLKIGAGGGLNLNAAGNLLITNVAEISNEALDSIALTTAGGVGTSGAFKFGSATVNGFVDANPVLSAKNIQINTSGKNAGIDTTGGTVAANVLTLATEGNVNFGSGSILSVVPNAVTGKGGTLAITAKGLTQSGGAAGFTLDASSAVGAGGTIVVNLSGSDDIVVGNGFLKFDISQQSTKNGGSITLNAAGDILADINAIDVGSNFGGAGPNLQLKSNAVLAVNNLASIANIGLGGGSVTSALIAGTPIPGSEQRLIVLDPTLPGGFVTIIYVEQAGDTAASVAQAFASLINANSDLQGIGVSATVTGATISFQTSSTNTTFNKVANGTTTITLDTLNTGLTLASRSSQPFVLGGAAAGTNGIQDNNLNLNIGAINISNTGSVNTATIGGTIKVGTTDSITITNAGLPEGFITVTYKVVDGDTHDTIAQALATAVNNNLDLQGVGVSATTDEDVIRFVADGATLFSSTPANGAKITIATLASGGDIVNGNLNSLTGAATKSAVLNASGSVGEASSRIQLLQGANSISSTAGVDNYIFSGAGANAVTVNAGNLADILFTGGGDINSLQGTAGTYRFKYLSGVDNANKVRVTSINTTNGDLIVESDAQTLEVSGTSKSVNGNIVLTNSRAQTLAKINILTGTTLHASGAVTALNQGNIYISMGAPPPAYTPAPGVVPAGNPTINETAGGKVTFGSTTNLAGSITAAPDAILEALGRNLSFNTTAGFGPSAIVVGSKAQITADPPPRGPVELVNPIYEQAMSRALSASQTLAGSTEANSSQMPITITLNSGASSTAMPVLNEVLDVSSALNTINTVGLNNAQFAELSLANLQSLNNLDAVHTAQLMSSEYATDTMSAFGTMEQQPVVQNEGSTRTTLVGGVSNIQHRRLENGPLLIAPQKDTIVDTPHGSISVAAKSLALIISSEQGVAVYNLHDARKHSVKVHTGNHVVPVAPGHSAMIVGPSNQSFEDFNPVQFVRYRQPMTKSLSNAAKLYHAEFEVFSMLQGLPGVKDLLQSDNEETRRTMRDVLKTAAILMQLSQGGGDFKHFVKPQVTAFGRSE